MSDIQRYEVSFLDTEIVPDNEGEFVMYKDFKKIEKEVDLYVEQIADLSQAKLKLEDENDRLRNYMLDCEYCRRVVTSKEFEL